MTVLELHRDLVTRILSVEDQAVLERLRLRLIEELEDEGDLDYEEEEGWSEELTDEQAIHLAKARTEVRKPENQVSHTEVMDFLKTGKRYETGLAQASTH